MTNIFCNRPKLIHTLALGSIHETRQPKPCKRISRASKLCSLKPATTNGRQRPSSGMQHRSLAQGCESPQMIGLTLRCGKACRNKSKNDGRGAMMEPPRGSTKDRSVSAIKEESRICVSFAKLSSKHLNATKTHKGLDISKLLSQYNTTGSTGCDRMRHGGNTDA